jgi:hypothetical protein
MKINTLKFIDRQNLLHGDGMGVDEGYNMVQSIIHGEQDLTNGVMKVELKQLLAYISVLRCLLIWIPNSILPD